MVNAQLSGSEKANIEEGQGVLQSLGKKKIEIGLAKETIGHMARGLSPGDKRLAKECIGAVKKDKKS